MGAGGRGGGGVGLKGRNKLQTLVYDILPSEEGAGKRCSECGEAKTILCDGSSKHTHTKKGSN